MHWGLLGVQGRISFPSRVQESRLWSKAHRNTEQLLVSALLPTG